LPRHGQRFDLEGLLTPRADASILAIRGGSGMPGRNVTRRMFVGVVGGSALAVPALASAFSKQPGETNELGLAPPTPENVGRLLAPLAAGKPFARWTVVSIDPIANGSVRVKVKTADEHVFDIEVLARDAASHAQRPPAETERHAVFVVNGGDGWTPTHEEAGLAAMTLAQVIERNEGTVRLSGFLTHAARIEHHQEALLVDLAPGALRTR
jgi:hypothetical protein